MRIKAMIKKKRETDIARNQKCEGHSRPWGSGLFLVWSFPLSQIVSLLITCGFLCDFSLPLIADVQYRRKFCFLIHVSFMCHSWVYSDLFLPPPQAQPLTLPRIYLFWALSVAQVFSFMKPFLTLSFTNRPIPSLPWDSPTSYQGKYDI